ncbi:MAG: hypothetical protein ABFD29_12070 [Anaerolineaceae bacterium]
MPKEFYTEKDIEDLVHRGVMSLVLNDNVYLTELAYEKAGRLGMRLIQSEEKNPSAPVRPYITKNMPQSKTTSVNCPTCPPVTGMPQLQAGGADELRTRIRSAVLNRLGSQVDPALLDRIIDRVLSNTGVK